LTQKSLFDQSDEETPRGVNGTELKEKFSTERFIYRLLKLLKTPTPAQLMPPSRWTLKQVDWSGKWFKDCARRQNI
jgi:hypothetical protein